MSERMRNVMQHVHARLETHGPDLSEEERHRLAQHYSTEAVGEEPLTDEDLDFVNGGFFYPVTHPPFPCTPGALIYGCP